MQARIYVQNILMDLQGIKSRQRIFKLKILFAQNLVTLKFFSRLLKRCPKSFIIANIVSTEVLSQ